MNPQEIFDKLNSCILALQQGNEVQKQLGLKKAEAEKKFRIKYNQKMLQLKAEGCQTTLITALTKSDPGVAELGMQRDIAESDYYTCISATENLRLEIETLRTQIAWLRSEMNNS